MSTSPRPALPRTVVALGVTSLLSDAASDMIFPLLPVFVVSLGGSSTFLGLIDGLAETVSSLFKWLSGYLADRLPRRKPLVVAGYAIASLAKPLVAFAIAPWHVLAVRVSDRIGKGLRTSSRDALLASAVPPEDSGRAFGFHRALDHAGAILGPLLATGLLALGVPLRSVFLVAIVPGLLSLVALFFVREQAIARPREHERRAVNERLSAPLRSYLAILAVFTVTSVPDALLLLRARDAGVSTALLPTLWMVFHVSKLVSAYYGGSWADRVRREVPILMGWFVYAATYLAFAFAHAAWHAWVLFVVYGCYYGLTEPAEKALVSELSSPQNRGRAFGVYNLIVGFCTLPAGLATGWLWDHYGALTALMPGAITSTACSIALLSWRRSERPRT